MTQTSFNDLNLSPMDEYNQTLVGHVHPLDWENPKPKDCYDLVVIGAGTAGLVTAKGAAGLDVGLKVALIERHLIGGDCLNVGCVPSKAVIRSSRAVADIHRASAYGVTVNGSVEVDFATVMQRMRRVRAQISPVDSALGAKKYGVDMYLGAGQFTGSNTIEVNGQTLRFKKAVITTGARAVRPSIEGIEAAGYLTNETVFNLTEQPRRLAVIGAGPIGCELAQSFRRLGSEVVLFERSPHVLIREDADAAEIVQQSFIKEGIQLVLNAKLHRVEKTAEGKVLHFSIGDNEQSVVVDEILVGAGRAPNVEGLGLETVGVDYDPRKGVKVNDYLQTTNPKIYAAGDVCMHWKFTHAADAAARIVLKNTLFSPFGLGRYHLSDLVMPWVTYTDPEIAHVGLYEQEAQAQGLDTNTIKISFEDVDRAIAEGEEEGFVKILHQKGSDEILGATIVASHAGEMISEITTAIVHKIGLSKMASVIHPYPTQAEAIKKSADLYRRGLLTPTSKKFLSILTKFS
ncbi:MAG: mercuric reductase [Leptolyngbyaceae bacterium]|nr:mercuric reductase [Leptolyngbyaceae bacterium]